MSRWIGRLHLCLDEFFRAMPVFFPCTFRFSLELPELISALAYVLFGIRVFGISGPGWGARLYHLFDLRSGHRRETRPSLSLGEEALFAQKPAS